LDDDDDPPPPSETKRSKKKAKNKNPSVASLPYSGDNPADTTPTPVGLKDPPQYHDPPKQDDSEAASLADTKPPATKPTSTPARHVETSNDSSSVTLVDHPAVAAADSSKSDPPRRSTSSLTLTSIPCHSESPGSTKRLSRMKGDVMDFMAAMNGTIPFDAQFSSRQLASQLKDNVADNVELTEFVSLFPMTLATRPPRRSANFSPEPFRPQDSTALPVPRTIDFSNKDTFNSRSPLPDSNHLRTRNALAATIARLDITLDFASCMDNFPPLDQLKMFMHLISSLCYRLIDFPSWDTILQLRHTGKDVSLLDHPFLIDLNKAEVLAVRQACLGPKGTYDSHLHKQALQRYDSGIFTSSLLVKCLCLTLDQKGCHAIEDDSSIWHSTNTPYHLQDGFWVFVWIVRAIMPSELCYKSVVTNAERKLKIAVPEAQRTTCHYRAFLDAVSCFSHHSQDMSSLFLKMFGAFMGCKDIEISNHIRAMQQLVCHNPKALNIRVAIATLKNLLTNMDEDQVKNAVVLASTTTSNEAEQSNIMAMPAIAQMQTQLNTIANSIWHVQLSNALYTPGPRLHLARLPDHSRLIQISTMFCPLLVRRLSPDPGPIPRPVKSRPFTGVSTVNTGHANSKVTNRLTTLDKRLTFPAFAISPLANLPMKLTAHAAVCTTIRVIPNLIHISITHDAATTIFALIVRPTDQPAVHPGLLRTYRRLTPKLSLPILI
jgi:hypothetical protein